MSQPRTGERRARDGDDDSPESARSGPGGAPGPGTADDPDDPDESYFTLREAAALLGVSAQVARWMLTDHGLEWRQNAWGNGEYHIHGRVLEAYLRARITPPPLRAPSPLLADIGDPAGLPFARAEVRAIVARLADTARWLTHELDAIHKLLARLDKREARQRQGLLLPSPQQRVDATRRVLDADRARIAAERAEAIRVGRPIVPGSGQRVHPLRRLAPGEHDAPAYAYRTRDGRLFFLYRLTDPSIGHRVMTTHVFVPAAAGAPLSAVALPQLPVGYAAIQGSGFSEPRLHRVPRIPKPVRDPRTGRIEGQRREPPPGSGVPPGGIRELGRYERDLPEAYAYRSSRGRLYFLVVQNQHWPYRTIQRYFLIKASPPILGEWPPAHDHPVPDVPEGYIIRENHLGIPYVQKDRS